MSKSLLLTLGHHSSAILVDNATGNVIKGIESERLTRVKSDSAYPQMAIEYVTDYGFPEKFAEVRDSITHVFVSHWFNTVAGQYSPLQDPSVKKYFNAEHFYSLFPTGKYELHEVNERFTHHTAHAYSGLAFYRNFTKTGEPGPETAVLVCDGFGTNTEVISVYGVNTPNTTADRLHLLKKYNGYECSLGLLYQYATSFADMKENKDEWKFLAYESHIAEHYSQDEISYLNAFADRVYDVIMSNIVISQNYGIKPYIGRKLISAAQLNRHRHTVYSLFGDMLCTLESMGKPVDDQMSKRVAVGYVVQSVTERIVKQLVESIKIEIPNLKNLILVGGIFYNVKLNNQIIYNTGLEKYSIMPISGDQGAAIGLYEYVFNNFKFGNQCWAPRNLSRFNTCVTDTSLPQRTLFFNNKSDLVDKAIELLHQDKLVQIVVGRSEYGPRALCHTSTVFRPLPKNAAINDEQNDRLSLMPLGPVMLRRNAAHFFDRTVMDKVVGSDRFMITTYDYLPETDKSKYLGVMHKYPLTDVYSGRPQIIDDESSTIGMILDRADTELGFKSLVNTSFNVHSEPIVHSLENALANFRFQQMHAPAEHRTATYLLLGNYEE